jgi:hypothetical protein
MTKKRRVPPAGVWVLLAGELRPGMWTAVVYTLMGEPVASAMHVRRERAERAALDEALTRARPERVLTEAELGDEHEELREAFAEHLAAWRELDAEHRDPEQDFIEAFADFLEVARDQLAPIVVPHDDDVIALELVPAAVLPPESVASMRQTGWDHELIPLVRVTGRNGTTPVSIAHLRVLTAALLRRAA